MSDDNDYKLEDIRSDLEIKKSGFKNAFAKYKRSTSYKIATHLIEKHHIKTVKGSKREVFVYREGVYVFGEDVLKTELRETLEELCNLRDSREILEGIKDRTAIDRENFKTDVNLINLNNGILDVRTGVLLAHDPQYTFFTKIPVDYRPDADCPMIKKYLSDVLDSEQIEIIQEWFGYCLRREYSIKKAIIFVGEGDTGKTTLVNVFFAFVGPNNVSGVSLQKISADKFAASHLYNKHINLYDDLSFKDINDNGAFKIATGGGVITGEKKFGDQFQFKNYAKLTFACNKIPDVNDTTDDAYFNRWIVIQFNRVVDPDKLDRQLTHKMTTAEELSGLLNFALEGLRRLQDNQEFSYKKEPHEIKTEMLRSGSLTARFVTDCLVESTSDWVKKEDMYYAFTKYASENKLPSVSMKAFGGKLRIYATYIADSKPVDPKTKKQVTAWRNVRLKPEYVQPEEPKEEEGWPEWTEEFPS